MQLVKAYIATTCLNHLIDSAISLHVIYSPVFIAQVHVFQFNFRLHLWQQLIANNVIFFDVEGTPQSAASGQKRQSPAGLSRSASKKAKEGETLVKWKGTVYQHHWGKFQRFNGERGACM